MTAQPVIRVLVLIAAAGGCKSSTGDDDGTDPGVDAIPSISFERFSSHTWSLSQKDGAAQLSISDTKGSAACALSVDMKNGLGEAGVQIIVQLPGMVSGTCPVDHFTLGTHCGAALGSGPYVPAGCAYYRKFDAQGATIGIAAAIAGEIDFSGSANECTIRTNVGFVGATFTEQASLINGAGAQPWCEEN
jgi:hypothetical protein